MMNAIQSRINKVKAFTGDVVSEIKKTTWPERNELIGSTAVVIVSVILLSVFVGASDKLLLVFLKVIIPSG